MNRPPNTPHHLDDFDDDVDFDIESKNGEDDILLPPMVYVPAGEYILGTSKKQVMVLYENEEWAKEWIDDGMFYIEQPNHRLKLDAFEIGRFPITNALYFQFIWDSNYRVPKDWIGFRYPEGYKEHPVVNVSLDDATAYCEWLNKQTGHNYHIPTEAEWEASARGNRYLIYPWGNVFDPWRCNTAESRKGETTPVGFYSPAGDSPLGVSDMAGNVWEWTCSRLIEYPFNPNPPALKPGEMERFVVRGGAWYYSRKLARIAAREGVLRNYYTAFLGFRVARSLTPKEVEEKERQRKEQEQKRLENEKH
jgi:formylglycine-generating enzyme required for sulfatase activity